jgi:hypothetical protein
MMSPVNCSWVYGSISICRCEFGIDVGNDVKNISETIVDDTISTCSEVAIPPYPFRRTLID